MRGPTCQGVLGLVDDGEDIFEEVFDDGEERSYLVIKAKEVK